MNEHPRSGPVRYEVVLRDGYVYQRKFRTAQEAVGYALLIVPDQEQDEDRTGRGWDIQVVGS